MTLVNVPKIGLVEMRRQPFTFLNNTLVSATTTTSAFKTDNMTGCVVWIKATSVIGTPSITLTVETSKDDENANYLQVNTASLPTLPVSIADENVHIIYMNFNSLHTYTRFKLTLGGGDPGDDLVTMNVAFLYGGFTHPSSGTADITSLGGVSLLIDGATYTPGANYLIPVGAEVDDPTALATETEGKITNLKTDLSGRLINTLGTLLAGEFLSEGSAGVLATARQPLSSSTFAWDQVASTAYEASKVIKGSAGRIRDIRGYNSKGSAQFIQIHDSATLPADTAVPKFTFTVPATQNFTIDFGEDGWYCTTGLVVSNSSTGPTKTIGSADCFFTVRYK